MEIREIIQTLPKVQRKMVVVTKNQDTKDIIDTLLDKHQRTKSEYDLISEKFWKGDPIATAKYLFDVLKKNVKYSVEGLDQQSVRTPATILVTGSGDCKHYASFINGVFDSLKRKGYPVDSIYRFAAYGNNKRPRHVFAVVKANGKEYWVDPVLKYFDQKNPRPMYQEDYKPATAEKIGALYDMSGVPGESHWSDMYSDQGQIGLSLKKIVSAPVKVVKGGAKLYAKGVTTAVKTAGKVVKPVAQVYKKVYGVGPRNAYLGLMKLNAFRFAKNIWAKAAYDRNSANWKKIADLWKKLGGNPDALYKAVKQGKDLWNRRHPNQRVAGITSTYYDMYDEQSDNAPAIGGEYFFEADPNLNAALGWIAGYYDNVDDLAAVGDPVSIAAILAAAAPIIAAMASLLAAMNVHKEGGPTGEEGFVPVGPAAGTDYMQTVTAAANDMRSGIPYESVPQNANVPDRYSNDVDRVDPEEDRDKTKDFFRPVREFYQEHKTAVNVGGFIIGGLIVYGIANRAIAQNKRRR